MLPHFEVFAPASTERGVKKFPLVLDDGTNLKSKDNIHIKLQWWEIGLVAYIAILEKSPIRPGAMHIWVSTFSFKVLHTTWKNEVSADHFWCAGKSFQETSTLVSSFGIETCNTSIPSPTHQCSQENSLEKSLPSLLGGNMFQPTDTHKQPWGTTMLRLDLLFICF